MKGKVCWCQSTQLRTEKREEGDTGSFSVVLALLFGSRTVVTTLSSSRRLFSSPQAPRLERLRYSLEVVPLPRLLPSHQRHYGSGGGLGEWEGGESLYLREVIGCGKTCQCDPDLRWESVCLAEL